MLSESHVFHGCKTVEARMGKLRGLIDDGQVRISNGQVYAKPDALPGIDNVPMSRERFEQEGGFRVVYSNDLADWVGGRAALEELGRYSAEHAQQNGAQR